MFYKESFVFELNEDLSYQSQGDQVTKELVLRAPTSKQESYVCQLQQKLTQAMFKTAKLVNIDDSKSTQKEIDENDEESKKAKNDFVSLALKAGCDDFFEFKSIIYKMLCSDGLCYINGPTGNVNLTTSLLGDIHLNDKDRLVSEYVGNFIAP